MNTTQVAKRLPELDTLRPLVADEPLLPLVPECERANGDYLRSHFVVA